MLYDSAPIIRCPSLFLNCIELPETIMNSGTAPLLETSRPFTTAVGAHIAVWGYEA